jgi:hypothetical protein
MNMDRSHRGCDEKQKSPSVDDGLFCLFNGDLKRLRRFFLPPASLRRNEFHVQ